MKNPNKARKTALYIALSMIVCSVILVTLTRRLAFGCLGAAAIVVYTVLCFLYWRCPNCRQFLPWMGGKIYACPYCRHQIEEFPANDTETAEKTRNDNG